MNAEQLATIPGLQYVQLPAPDFRWFKGMHPFALQLIEEWPGYVDVRNVRLDDAEIDADELIATGWTPSPLAYWTRYDPPGGPRPPASKEAAVGPTPTTAQAENREPSTSRYTTTTARRDANPHPITAHYADGRPARRADGTVIRYDAAGRPHEFTPNRRPDPSPDAAEMLSWL